MSWRNLLRIKPIPNRLIYNVNGLNNIVTCNIHKELKVRIAHKINELDTFPYGISELDRIKFVKGLYIDSFNILDSSTYKDDNYVTKLEDIKNRHFSISNDIGIALQDYKITHTVDFNNINKILNKFYSTRIGIRTLISYVISINNNTNLINKNCNPYKIIEDVIDDANNICYHKYCNYVDIQLTGDSNDNFIYIDQHLYYILLEILKNAIEATINNNPDEPILINLEYGKDEIIIKIHDKGGGFSRKEIKKLFSYFYTTSSYKSDLSGYGFGLPLAKVYAQYFGGDLLVLPIDSVGTDVYIYINKLGLGLENI